MCRHAYGAGFAYDRFADRVAGQSRARFGPVGGTGDQAESGKQGDGLLDELSLHAWFPRRLGPESAVFGGEFPHPLGEPVSCDRSAHPGQVLREQQGDVAVGTLLRHPDIGEVVVCVDHGDTLGPDLGNQAGQVGHPGGEEPRCRVRQLSSASLSSS